MHSSHRFLSHEVWYIYRISKLGNSVKTWGPIDSWPSYWPSTPADTTGFNRTRPDDGLT